MKMCPNSFQTFLSQWRLWIRPFLIALYVIWIFVLVPIFVVQSIKHGIKKSDLGPIVGGGFVLLALPISIWEINLHILNLTKPSLQKHIIRILWMVPIYALNAWLGLIFPEHAIYMDSLRECYEAYVIYNFMKYLLNYLNEDHDLEALLETKPQVYHIFPLCHMKPWEMGSEFIHNCKHGILQYTVVRPVTTIVSMICEYFGVYGESEFSSNVAYPYIVAINNVSQFVAMYCLVLFYKAHREELRPMKPIGKFLCIKAVVFFSFFQGVIINMLVYFGVISIMFDEQDADKIKVMSSKLQNFLICIEMFLAAIAHHYSFSYKAFVREDATSPSCLGSFFAIMDVSDVKEDISEHLGVVGGSVSRRLRGKTLYQIAKGSDESSKLMSSEQAAPSSSAPNAALDGPSTSTYGSIDTTVTTASSNSETHPLLNSDIYDTKDDPNV